LVNYGYGPYTEGYDKTKESELTTRLRDLIMQYQLEEYETSPYVEVDGLYHGVRIRKITNLPDEKKAELITKADQIYKETMLMGNEINNMR